MKKVPSENYFDALCIFLNNSRSGIICLTEKYFQDKEKLKSYLFFKRHYTVAYFHSDLLIVSGLEGYDFIFKNKLFVEEKVNKFFDVLPSLHKKKLLNSDLEIALPDKDKKVFLYDVMFLEILTQSVFTLNSFMMDSLFYNDYKMFLFFIFFKKLVPCSFSFDFTKKEEDEEVELKEIMNIYYYYRFRFIFFPSSEEKKRLKSFLIPLFQKFKRESHSEPIAFLVMFCSYITNDFTWFWNKSVQESFAIYFIRSDSVMNLS